MRNNERIMVAWLIGYFIVLYPIFISTVSGSLNNGLFSGIFGLTGAILIWRFAK